MNAKPYYVAHPATTGVKPSQAPNAAKYPWNDLKVLGWFEAPASVEKSLRAQASRRARKDGRTYRVEKRDAETVRVWRMT